MATLELSTLVTYNPLAVAADTPLSELAERVQTLGLRHWPVVDDERRVIGVVAEGDVIRALQMRHLAAAVTAGSPTGGEACAGELISSDFWVVQEAADARWVLGVMLDRQLDSVPVIRDGRLIGMITASDYLREFTYGEIPAAREPVTRHLRPIGEPLDASLSLDDALFAMMQDNAQWLAVVRGGCPLGVISRQELAKAKCRELASELEAAPRKQPAAPLAALVAGAPTLRPAQRMTEAADLLLDRKLQAVAVANQAQQLMGVISVEGILRTMHAQMG